MSDETYRPGDSCGPYRIDSFLEAGGFAEVYCATNLLTGRRAALKVLQADRMRIEEVLQRFKHEIQLLATLQHVNVVGFYEAGTHASRIYAAMELLEGRTLRVHVHERGALDVEEALGILYEIACGVAAAQEIGVVHRDIKPENVFLTRSGVAKVLDFGIAKFEGWGFQSTGRERRGMLGTPSYMSPEQIEGVPPTFASDVYQAGLVAHEMLTGRHAWSYQNGELPTQMQLCELQVNAMPRALVGVRQDVRALIEKALCKRPEDRFADMDQLAAATWEVMETIRLERSGPDKPEDRRNPPAADGSPLGPLARRAFQPAHTPARETPPPLPARKVELRGNAGDERDDDCDSDTGGERDRDGGQGRAGAGSARAACCAQAGGERERKRCTGSVCERERCAGRDAEPERERAAAEPQPPDGRGGVT